MFPQELIRKKRDGHELTIDEIQFFVDGVGSGGFCDYQTTALLMAIFFRGLNDRETVALTSAMMHSGEVIDLSHVRRPKVDKHSTGGVGDKVSLILAPLAVAAGLSVPMVSGRGLGHTGGTLDKLQSIPGFNVGLSITEYKKQVFEIHQALIGQTETLVPCDKKLYALRDVTATVECIPLICASIMSKKLAEGIDALVLDVKVGNGAFMTTEEDARALANAMIAIGKGMNKPTSAILTRMDQPLGHSVGNALEVIESIECLKGNGPEDLMTVTLNLTAEMLRLGGLVATLDEGLEKLQTCIDNGTALEEFCRIIKRQGGDVGVVDDYKRFPQAATCRDLIYRHETPAAVTQIDTRAIGLAAMELGAGRKSVSDIIDPSVGFSDFVKVGQTLKKGDRICRIHGNGEEIRVEKLLLSAIQFGDVAQQTNMIIERLLWTGT